MEPSRFLTRAGLAAQLLGLLWVALGSAPDPGSRGTLLLAGGAAAPVLLALLSGWRAPAQWGKWIATLMVPYMCGYVTAVMTSLQQRPLAATLTLLSITTFFLGLDTARRAPPSRPP